MQDELSLIERARNGEQAAFRALYERYRGDAARIVFRMLGRRPELEDVVQEVFVQVYRSLKDFRGQSKFSTWLHRVSVNVVLMHRRSAKSRPVLSEEVSGDFTPDAHAVRPDEDTDRRARIRAFSRVLDKLGEKKRTVFILHELEGMAPAEIAEIVGAPVLTVRTRLFYARREIEALMAEEPVLRGISDAMNGEVTASEEAPPLSQASGEAR